MGAVFLEVRVERDIYLTHPQRDFSLTDEAFRIRSVSGSNVLTYKGPKLDPLSKTRVEIEVNVDCLDDTRELFERLGFTPAMEIVKTRRYYRHEDLDVCLDDVEGLGTYVEVEGRGTDIDCVRNRARAILDRLGLKGNERRSYMELLFASRKLPLFTYGLLMDPETLRDRFGLDNVRSTPATVSGVLYDSGRYPVMMDGQGVVMGMLLESDDLPIKMDEMDQFEGHVPGDDSSLYLRKVRTVNMQEGKRCLAWVYLGNVNHPHIEKTVAEENKILSGSWETRKTTP